MGYTTYFTDMTEPPCTPKELDKLEEIAGWRIILDDSMKWYDYEIHMAKLSTFFPERLFRLNGDGEESDDFWKGYWRNGKCFIDHALITYSGFEEDKMHQVVDPIPEPKIGPEVPLGAMSEVILWDF